MRKWRVLILAFVLIPLAVGAETISWTPNPVSANDPAVSFTPAQMSTMTFYIRAWKAGSAAKTYLGETRNGATTWTDNILLRANQWGATVPGWVALKPGDNILVSVSMAFVDNGVEKDSAESPGYAYMIPGGAVPALPPTATFSAAPASIVKGACTTLTWATQNAASVAIDQGVGTVTASGTKSVCPIVSTIYSITAIGSGGTKVAMVTVNVSSLPTTTPGCSPPTGITIKP